MKFLSGSIVSVATAVATLTLPPLTLATAGNTWDGGGSSGNWNDALNWDANTLPNTSQPLAFGGSNQLNSVNNLFPFAGTIHGISFLSGAGPFELSGTQATLGGDIINNSSSLQTISINLSNGGVDRSFLANSGDLTLTGILTGAGNVTIGGTGITTISGSGNSTLGGLLSVSQNATLSFNTSGDYSFLTGFVPTGTMRYTGGTGSIFTTLLADGGTVDVTEAATTLAITGQFSAQGGTNTFTKTGAGTLQLSNQSNAVTDLGIQVSAGTLHLADGNTAMGANGVKDVTVDNGAQLKLSGAGGQLRPSGTLTVDSGGTVDIVTSQTVGSLSGQGLVTTSGAGLQLLNVSVSTGSSEFAGVIEDGAGSLQLRKSGAGTLVLSGNNTYTGATSVFSNGGTLLINGSTAAGSGVSVESGATLGGTGTVGGDTVLFNGALLSPGTNSPDLLTFQGDLNISDATFFSNPVLKFELGTSSDQVSVAGELAIGFNLDFDDFDFTVGTGFSGGSYVLFQNGSLNGFLGAGNLTGTVGGLSSTLAVVGSDLVLNVVPEPGSAVLVLFAICCEIGVSVQILNIDELLGNG